MLDLENVLCFYADIKPVLDDKALGSGRDWKEQKKTLSKIMFSTKIFPLPRYDRIYTCTVILT